MLATPSKVPTVFDLSILNSMNDKVYAKVVDIMQPSKDAGLPQLLLVRGIPGSGKSYVAKRVANLLQGIEYETDKQFTKGGSDYEFDASLLGAAHDFTQNEVRVALNSSEPIVTVANTFTRLWEFENYLNMAQQFGYQTVIVDLYRAHLQQDKDTLDLNTLSKLPHYIPYLDFLGKNNDHNVDRAKIGEMAERYELSEQVITIIQRPDKTFNHNNSPVRVIDKGKYISLEIVPAGFDSNDHSSLFLACLHACHELMILFGIEQAAPMIRKMIDRNMKAVYINKKQKKLVSGWNLFHLTLVQPAEYEILKENNKLTSFLESIQSIDFNQLSHNFNSLKERDSSKQEFNRGLADVKGSIGMVNGAITIPDKPAATPTLLQTESTEQSITFFLALNKSCEPLAEFNNFRRDYGLSSTDWFPHITLAFTHNDVHDMSRINGVADFQVLRARSSIAATVVVNSSCSLTEDLLPTPRLTELLLHSEVQSTFSKAFNFMICDLKMRRGPFGDDAGYRANPILLELLPRGMTFIQDSKSKRIYRGLHSLKKFFGKEGMEDDGFGLASGEFNRKLNDALTKSTTLLLMEKENGRAGSARFFTHSDVDYAIVGTKLVHTIGRLDHIGQKIDLDSTEFPVINSDSQEEAVSKAKLQFDSKVLITSNALALERSIKWHQLPAMLSWLNGRTLNGEILDPDEMHLVRIGELSWISLCLTDFDSEQSSSSLVKFLEDSTKFLQFTPSYRTLNLLDTASSTEASALEEKKQKVLYAAKTTILDEASEGKVLYLLDRDGVTVEMIKYKTWWYIYRRAIREITKRVITKTKNQPAEPSSDANNNNNKSGKKKKIKTTVVDAPIAISADQVVENMCIEVKQKWQRKFTFVQDDLGESYEKEVEQATELAVQFLRFMQTKLTKNRDETVFEFQSHYPLVWDEFIAQRKNKNSIATK